MIHLVCGPIGAGKTTIARSIANEFGAIRFSEDEWLEKLFVPDAPYGLMDESPDVIAAWAIEKYQRCRNQIWLVCQQLLSNRLPVVLDGAAATKEQRDQIRGKAEDSGVGFMLHYVTADQTTRRQRVLNRNTEKGMTYSLHVTEGMFDLMESFFETPSASELINARLITN